MVLLGRLLIALAILAILSAIWVTGRAWELGGTAFVFFVTGGAILGSRPGAPE